MASITLNIKSSDAPEFLRAFGRHMGLTKDYAGQTFDEKNPVPADFGQARPATAAEVKQFLITYAKQIVASVQHQEAVNAVTVADTNIT